MAFGTPTVGSARVRLELDRSRYDRDWARARQDASRSGKHIGTALKVGVLGLASLGAGAAVAGKRLADMAGDAAEVDSKFKVVFGRTVPGVTKEINAFAKATGASRYELKAQVADLGALLRPLVQNQRETGKMSIAVAKLATDLSSFNNVPVEESLLAIRSGLIGEAEPLRRFGVLLNAAKVEAEALRVTGKKNADQLTDAEKVQARYNLIMRQTSLAQGDATRTAGSYANMNRRVRNRLNDVATDIGRVLLPAFDSLLGFVDDKIIPRLEDFSGFLDDLFKERTFKGKVGFALSGAQNLGQDLIDALFAPRGGYRYAIPMDGDRFRIVMRGQTSLAEDLAADIADGIEEIDWHAVGMTIADGIKAAFALTKPVAKAALKELSDVVAEDARGSRPGRAHNWFAEVTGINDAGPFKDAGNALFGVAKGLFGKLEGEAHAASGRTSTTWARSMARVEATSRRALADVRGELRKGGASALAAAGMVENLRGEINRVKGKDVNVTANVHLKFKIPGGFSAVEDLRPGRDGIGVLDRRIHDLAKDGIPTNWTGSMPGLARADVHPHLWDELGMAAMLGLRVSSTHRPGAVTRSGNKSYHSYSPSRAVDLASGSTAGYGDPSMRQMFDWASGRSGLNEVILDPYIWTPGGGRRSIAGTQLGRDHRDHVHLGGMGDGLGVGGPRDVFELTGPAFRRFMGDGLGVGALPPANRVPDKFKLKAPPRRKTKSGKWAETGAEWRQRILDLFEGRLASGTTTADYWLDIGRSTAERRQRVRDADNRLTEEEAAGRRGDLEILGRMMDRKRRFFLAAAKWAGGHKLPGRASELKREAGRLQQELYDLNLDIRGVEPTPSEEADAGTGTTFEEQARAFLTALEGIQTNYASNIDYAGGVSGAIGGSVARPYAPAQSPVAGGGGSTVIVNQNFTQPPTDPYPSLTTARWAAEGVFL